MCAICIFVLPDENKCERKWTWNNQKWNVFFFWTDKCWCLFLECVALLPKFKQYQQMAYVLLLFSAIQFLFGLSKLNDLIKENIKKNCTHINTFIALQLNHVIPLWRWFPRFMGKTLARITWWIQHGAKTKNNNNLKISWKETTANK